MARNWKRLINNLAELAGTPSRIVKPVIVSFNARLQVQFKQATDSYGTPWVPIAPSTVRKKGGSTLIMIETGKTKTETKAIALPGAGIGFVSTTYAGYHIDRVGNRPARPIFPHRKDLPIAWRKDIETEWAREFKKVMSR